MASAAEQFSVGNLNQYQVTGLPYEGFGSGLWNWWTGTKTRYYNEQAQQQAILDKKYEQDTLASARAWEEYLTKQQWQREDSQYQRAVNDLVKAGLNPWLAVNGGSLNGSSSGVASSSASGSSAKGFTAKKEKSKAGENLISLVGTAAKILMTLAVLG